MINHLQQEQLAYWWSNGLRRILKLTDPSSNLPRLINPLSSSDAFMRFQTLC